MKVSRVYFAVCGEVQDAHIFCPSEVSIHSAVCLTTGPQPLPKPLLHAVRSSPSSVNLQYPVFSWMSSNSWLHISPRLSVTSTLPSIFLSIQCFRRQFPRQLWPIHLPLLHSTVCRILLSPLSPCTTFSFLTRSVQMIFSSLFQHQFQNFSSISDLLSEVSKFQHDTINAPNVAFFQFLLKFKSTVLQKRLSACWLLKHCDCNPAFNLPSVVTLHNLPARLAPSVITLPISKFCSCFALPQSVLQMAALSFSLANCTRQRNEPAPLDKSTGRWNRDDWLVKNLRCPRDAV